jgi:hypothetical protein
MSHLKYHNNLVELINTFYDSHLDLIRNICNDLGQSDKIKEMEEKYLDTTNKLKAKKDPTKPKKPKTSYLFFCDEMRSKLMAKNPKANLSEISKELGLLWKDCERSKYTELANKDKDRYTDEISKYSF